MRNDARDAGADQESTAPTVDVRLALGDLLHSGFYERLNLKERLYVALLTQRHDLLSQEGFSTMQALAVLPETWAQRIFNRWFADAATVGLSMLRAEESDTESAACKDILH